MLFRIQSFEDLAKNVVDPPVVGILYIQEFADFFWFNNVSLKIRLPHVRKGLERELSYHALASLRMIDTNDAFDLRQSSD